MKPLKLIHVCQFSMSSEKLNFDKETKNGKRQTLEFESSKSVKSSSCFLILASMVTFSSCNFWRAASSSSKLCSKIQSCQLQIKHSINITNTMAIIITTTFSISGIRSRLKCIAHENLFRFLFPTYVCNKWKIVGYLKKYFLSSKRRVFSASKRPSFKLKFASCECDKTRNFFREIFRYQFVYYKYQIGERKKKVSRFIHLKCLVFSFFPQLSILFHHCHPGLSIKTQTSCQRNLALVLLYSYFKPF